MKPVTSYKDCYLGGQALRQVPQGSGHSPEPVSVQEAFGPCSQLHGLTSGLP